MKIGIDARLYGPKHTGIGRYVKNLITHLLEIDHKNQYFLFGDPKLLLPLAKHNNVHIVGLKTRIYTLKEQAINPVIIGKYKLDLLHVPHFNAPLLTSTKLVLTIHDLIKHLSTGSDTTTLPKWQYGAKHLGYKALISLNLKKANQVITPSNYWKNYLEEKFNLDSKKITVTYEAVDDSLKPTSKPKPIHTKYKLKKPFLVYTGNLYPHKNVNLLIGAVERYNQTFDHKIELAIISGRSQFTDKIKPSERIKLLGFVPDRDLPDLYANAIALVQPSLIEGFGLTGLEAMKLKLPVLSSNSSCLPEVYGDAALYFDPKSEQDLIEKLDQVVKNHSLRKDLSTKGIKWSKKFSWEKTAKQTLKVYNTV